MNYPDSVNSSQIDDATKPMEPSEYDAIIADEAAWLAENIGGEELIKLFMAAKHDSLRVKCIKDALELAVEEPGMHDEAIEVFDLYFGYKSAMFALCIDIIIRGHIADEWTRVPASRIGFAIENVVKDELKSLAEYNYSNNCLKHGV